METINITTRSFDEQHELDFLNGAYNSNTDHPPITEKDIYDALNF